MSELGPIAGAAAGVSIIVFVLFVVLLRWRKTR